MWPTLLRKSVTADECPSASRLLTIGFDLPPRICCDVDPDEVSAAEPDNDEGIEQVETESWNNEQGHRP
jgi:hypothetical protein